MIGDERAVNDEAEGDARKIPHRQGRRFGLLRMEAAMMDPNYKMMRMIQTLN